MQEKGQKCKKSDVNLYTKKQAVIACLSGFLLNFLISNVLFPYIAHAKSTTDLSSGCWQNPHTGIEEVTFNYLDPGCYDAVLDLV